MRLLNRVALITGANNPRSIGAEVARMLAAEGAQIALTYRILYSTGYSNSSPGNDVYSAQKAKDADEVLASINEAGGTAKSYEADLLDIGSAAHIFDWAESNLGPVEILVNCAAHSEASGDSILKITPEAIDQTLAVNVRATVQLTREFMMRHRERRATYGRIVNFSTDGAQCFPGQIIYGASKAAIESLTRSIAKETLTTGVTVNAIAPGPIQTGYIDAEHAKSLAADLCENRIGSARDVADAVLNFVLPSASWITGQVLTVAGGHNL